MSCRVTRLNHNLITHPPAHVSVPLIVIVVKVDS
jgi:hypothetical protein